MQFSTAGRSKAQHFVRAVCSAAFAFGLLSLPASAQSGVSQVSTPSNQTAPQLSALQLQSWRASLAQAPLPERKGCFSSHYPNAFWQDVPCVTPPNVPYRPAHAGGHTGGPSSVGNGNDYVATTDNLISSASGSFVKTSGVLNEADGGQANRYSLQLNTNFFHNTPACNSAANPSNCQGWEQFVYSNAGIAFIQYWLINYSTTCPSGWNTNGNDCWKNAPEGGAYPPQPVTDLSGELVTGTANGSTDTIEISGPGGEATAANGDSVLSLANHWNNAEFNIVGDCCGSTANFNSGITIKVRTQVSSGTNSAPGCAIAGTTGEMNNTNLVAPCTEFKGSAPAIEFSESNPPGSIWVYTGAPCNGTSCTGWQQLDGNNESVRIATTGGTQLYQLWNTGTVYKYTGTPCNDTSCPGWKRIDTNPNTFEIVAGGNHLYQLEDDGKLWQYISGTEWRLLDNNTNITTMVAASGGLFELHSQGDVWEFTGSPCTNNDGTDCPGWQQLDNNPNTVEITTNLFNLYELHQSGTIWKYTGTPCTDSGCAGWQQLGDNATAVRIVAGGNNLYELDSSGTISKYKGKPCTSSTSCTSWQKLDDNPAAIEIAADDQNNLYELHDDGSVWKYTGTPCNGSTCTGWQMLDNNPATGRIAASSGMLYELHVILTPPAQHANACYECR